MSKGFPKTPGNSPPYAPEMLEEHAHLSSNNV